MPVVRFAISVDRDLAREIKESAAGQPLSAWLADAAISKLRSEGLLTAIAGWEAVHGEITEAELQVVRERHRALRRRRSPTKAKKRR